MKTVYARVPRSSLRRIIKNAEKYSSISRSPLNEICRRAIYWGGTWGLFLNNAPRSIPGAKHTVSVSVPNTVGEEWEQWLTDYGISSAYAIVYLCTVMQLPPIPLDWELGAIAASTWYQDRSLLRLVPEALPKRRTNGKIIVF
jgi:hypothetical protein